MPQTTENSPEQTKDFGELLSGVEIMRTGTHRAMNGLDVTLTAEQLLGVAQRYDPAVHEAPIVIGHPEHDKPAYGWVKKLDFGSGILRADIDAAPEFVEAIRRGFFKKRSASLYPDLAGKGLYLRHIGFLGAMPPSIKGLADINLTDDRSAVVFEFTEKEKAMSWKDRAKGLFTQAVDEIPETAEAIAGTAQRTVTTVNFSEEEVSRREKEAAQKAVEAAKLEFAEERKKLDAERLAASHTTEVKSKIESMVNSKDGRVTPAMVKAGLIEFAQSLPWQAETVIEFAEGKKQSACEWFLGTFLPGLPKQIEFGEVANRASDTGKGGASQKLDLLTQKKMQANQSLTYSMAFSEVQKENPGLVAEYHLELGR
jgi:hypothetical protein